MANRKDTLVTEHNLTDAEIAELVRINRLVLATFDRDYQQRYPDQTASAYEGLIMYTCHFRSGILFVSAFLLVYL